MNVHEAYFRVLSIVCLGCLALSSTMSPVEQETDEDESIEDNEDGCRSRTLKAGIPDSRCLNSMAADSSLVRNPESWSRLSENNPDPTSYHLPFTFF